MAARQAGSATYRWQPALWRVAAAVACVVGGVGLAQAQYAVQQNGRLLDANPQVGSGGYNYARPVSPLLTGNALLSGNLRGMAFQGFNPIPSPTAFRGSLGSSALSAFQRDSVSVADVGVYSSGMTATPYFDPSQTVFTAGLHSGQYGSLTPGVGTLSVGPVGSSSIGPLDLRLDRRLAAPPVNPSALGVPALSSQIVGLTPTGSSELSSTIFGPPRQSSSPRSATGLYVPEPVAGLQSQLGDLSRVAQPGVREFSQPGEVEAMRVRDVPGSRPPLGTPLEMVQRGELSPVPLELRQDPFASGMGQTGRRPLALGPVANEPDLTEPAPSTRTPSRPQLRLTDTSVLPGQDVFTDMQLGLALEREPDAAWFRDMQAAMKNDPAVAGLVTDVAVDQSQTFLNRLFDAPIRTFHGGGDSAFNDELLKAESLLEIGLYYEAARRYESANRLEPLNPLPLIGKGNAYLAAGEYLSATVALVQGFSRYPELSRFDFDLKSLMGGGEIVDIRRADIRKRLEQQDDARLRFLLGYLEYYAGDKQSGLKNLEQAADLDRGESIISSFPAMLRDGGKLPPPKLPMDVPSDVPATPTAPPPPATEP
ncbi:MAG: hypothetical protein PVJ57_05395 [Phycisphaerae bacterium]|jgi:hypothetical protein